MSLPNGKRRSFYLTVANSIFFIHTGFFLMILAGWAIPGIFYVYLPMLIASLVSELLLGYCVLTKWEFGIRKRLFPAFRYEHSFLIHYARKFFHIGSSVRPGRKSTKLGGYVFVLLLLSSLTLGVVFRLFVYA